MKKFFAIALVLALLVGVLAACGKDEGASGKHHVQGGDPEGTGMGGSDEKIKGEFTANGVQNRLSHTRGAISMARSNAYDSASSQFFIVHQDSTFLDGQYACFGYVTSGMDIVDAICEGTPVTDGNGTVKDGCQPVIETIRVID